MRSVWALGFAAMVLGGCNTGEATSGTSTGGVGGSGGAGGSLPMGATEDMRCDTRLSPHLDMGATRVDIGVPNGVRLVSVRSEFIAADNHSILPEFPPSMQIIVSTKDKPAEYTIAGSVIDLAGSVAEYETPHPVTVEPDAKLIVNNDANLYALLIASESGKGAKEGGVFFGWTCRIQLP